MNEPSIQKVNHDLEEFIHILLDHIIDGKRIIFKGVLPKSVMDRMEEALIDGHLSGYFKERLDKPEGRW